MRIFRAIMVALVLALMLLGMYVWGFSRGWDYGSSLGGNKAYQNIYMVCDRGGTLFVNKTTIFYCGRVNKL